MHTEQNKMNYEPKNHQIQGPLDGSLPSPLFASAPSNATLQLRYVNEELVSTLSRHLSCAYKSEETLRSVQIYNYLMNML